MFGKNAKTYSRNCGGGGGIGEDGARGYDGNSSLWKGIDQTETPEEGEFTVRASGATPNIITRWDDGEVFTANVFDKNDNDLTAWFLYLNIGDVITIRNGADQNDVANYRVNTNPILTGSNVVSFSIVFISSGSEEFYSKNKEYYISYVKTGPSVKTYDFGTHIMPIQEKDTSNNKLFLPMDSLSMGNGVTFMDNFNIEFKEESVVGWIYPGYGGMSQYTDLSTNEIDYTKITVDSENKNFNWSDRSSVPTMGYSNVHNNNFSYSSSIARSINSKIVLDQFTDFSWFFGPYDPSFNLADVSGISVDGMAVHIVHIPKTNNNTPSRSSEWNFVRIVLDISGGSANSIRLDPTINNYVSYWKGEPTIPWNENANSISDISENSISINPGDGLGICIFSNNLGYSHPSLTPVPSTGELWKISPATFCVKPRIEF